MPPTDLKNVESHFEFGRNWASYAKLIGDPEIAEATKGLLKLLQPTDLAGRTFLDIGCGSGLHALAASRLGVARIMAVDIDPVSVETTKAVLSSRDLSVPWRAEQISVFDLDPARLGTFDVVYSWGVLHHTGHLQQAIERAAAMVAPGGLLALALYRRTRADWFWVREKKWYTGASPKAQKIAQRAYCALYQLSCLRSGTSYRAYVDTYRSARGMDFVHDVHDWLGGYPYESILATELGPRLEALGFKPVRVFAGAMTRGLLGSGCDEYVYKRTA